MLVAKAELVGFHPDIRLHHRCAENYIELVALQTPVQLAERATERRVITARIKLLVDGDCKNLFQKDSSPSFRQNS